MFLRQTNIAKFFLSLLLSCLSGCGEIRDADHHPITPSRGNVPCLALCLTCSTARTS